LRIIQLITIVFVVKIFLSLAAIARTDSVSEPVADSGFSDQKSGI